MRVTTDRNLDLMLTMKRVGNHSERGRLILIKWHSFPAPRVVYQQTMTHKEFLMTVNSVLNLRSRKTYLIYTGTSVGNV